MYRQPQPHTTNQTRFLQLFLSLVHRSMADLTREQLRQVLTDLGETPVPSWTKVELRHRIFEKTGEDMSKNVKAQSKAVSPCQQLVKELNRASNKKKADLVTFCTEKLGMPTPSVNRTVAQLQMDAMKRIMQTTPPHQYDVVGFGKYSDRSYLEIQHQFREYGMWVRQTYAENKDTCDSRLQRLAVWLESQENEELKTPETPLERFKGYQKPKAKATTPATSSSSTSDPNNEVLTEMLGAIKELRQEVAALKQEPVRKKQMKTEDSELDTEGSYTHVLMKK